MLARNATKEVIQPFSIGNEERQVGFYMAFDGTQTVKRRKMAMVEVFTPALKPGEVCNVPDGLFECMGGIKPRGSYIASLGLAGKLVPVEAKAS